MRKFLITGSTSSGKTTLLKSVGQLLTKHDLRRTVGIAHEIARPLLHKYPEFETNPLFQELLFMAQVGRESQAEQKGYQYLLCDRGSLDIVVFSRFFGHPVQTEWLDHLRSYETVFVCQADFPVAVTALQQQVSPRDWQIFRDDWQALLYEVLAELKVEPLVLAGDPETRLKRFLGELSLRHQQAIEGTISRPEQKEL